MNVLTPNTNENIVKISVNNLKSKKFAFPSPCLDTNEENVDLREDWEYDIATNYEKLLRYQDDQDIGKFEDINLSYDIESPRLPIIEELDLSSIPKRYQNGKFDCHPFFHCVDYESKFDTDDILELIVNDEINDVVPIFDRELEFKELEMKTSKFDCVVHFLLGVDTTGYFELKKQRSLFLESPWRQYIEPLRYADAELTINDSCSDVDFDEIEQSSNYDGNESEQSQEYI
ncbi:hypothetical protein KAFR_0B02660 [Kazachstania africana CBS 2517]|uniref:Uncharacterized protein n=1 Tax=Kazachstania africana (strain ATCC 22294 / BCRC 22015 / CBS 2517 / CECT 1963 / NBRC 1671 / NRRL Y-8276) TaxID=1071382 RepID=H2AQB3_KAZAF|nr:hypothetical protein KAFR_0B02660 [Kazachstania africana CBS 2517]CCF56563.1 hypothetical protein KAFR_0B02660 [Kazachstania africana CBS 2517]